MTEPRALITGASAGLGTEFARQLASKGKDLILVARRTEPMEKLARELVEDYNVAVDVIQADLSDPSATSKLFADVGARGLQVDYLINNAGSVGPDLLADRDWPEQQKYIELMMTSVAGMCHHFIPPMQERGFGRVLNVASVAAFGTSAGNITYCATKAFLKSFSEGLAIELEGTGIRVQALCPGYTRTEIHERASMSTAKTPESWWLTAEEVVEHSYRGLARGQIVCVPGMRYRIITALAPLFPATLQYRLKRLLQDLVGRFDG